MQKDSYNGSTESYKAPIVKIGELLASVLQAASSRRHLELVIRAKQCKTPQLHAAVAGHTHFAATQLCCEWSRAKLPSFADRLPAHFPRAVAREEILRSALSPHAFRCGSHTPSLR